MSGDLESLGREAADADRVAGAAGDPAAAAAPTAASPVDAGLDAEAKEWAAAPAIFGRIVGRVLPELNDVYTEKANLDWGRAMVPLARQYGWTFQKFIAWAGPWVMLGLASESLVTPTVMAVAKKIKENRAAAKQPAAKPEAKPVE